MKQEKRSLRQKEMKKAKALPSKDNVSAIRHCRRNHIQLRLRFNPRGQASH